nr:mRNA interferase [Burkholderia ubonensis]
MRQEEFREWLAMRGARFEVGANHIKAYLNGKQATLPKPLFEELKEGTVKVILKQLGSPG